MLRQPDRLLLITIAVLSLGYGGVFLFAPNLFVGLSAAEGVNVGWLRNIGAALVSVQGFGTFVALRSGGNRDLLYVLGTASIAEALALFVSVALGEFTAARTWMIIGPAIAAGASGGIYIVVARRLAR